MHNFPAGYALAVINNRIKILLASLLLVVISIAVIVAKPLGYNNSNEMWFLPGDPNLVSFEKLLSKNSMSHIDGYLDQTINGTTEYTISLGVNLAASVAASWIYSTGIRAKQPARMLRFLIPLPSPQTALFLRPSFLILRKQMRWITIQQDNVKGRDVR